jgi:hypothetical protein
MLDILAVDDPPILAVRIIGYGSRRVLAESAGISL